MSDEQQASVVEGRPPRPRRVILRRNQDGAYEIFARGRLIQTFCTEFEDITRWAMELNSEQQVRILIEPMGNRRQLSLQERVSDFPVRMEGEVSDEPERSPAPEEALSQIGSEATQTRVGRWQDAAREQLVREIELRQNMIDMLAGM